MTHVQEVADEIADRLLQQRPELAQGGHAIVARDEFNNETYRAEMDEVSIRNRRSVN